MEYSNRYCVDVEGVMVPRFFSKECFQSALRLKPKKGDVFVVTYPKCGTTWMQNLVLNIMRRGKKFEKPSDFHFASPFLDLLGADDSEKRMISPGCYKTHLPLHKVPWSDAAKYIYVARNPKDCCVSLYHHMKVLPGYQFADGTFPEFFDLFINGQVEFGDYFDHLIPWYKARNQPNVFFTTFEEMKTDLEKVAMEVAEFTNKTDAEFLNDNPEVLERILHNCCFEETKKLVNVGLSSMYNTENIDLPKGRRHIIEYIESLPKRAPTVREIKFIRKGEIGSYKHELTEVQNAVLSKIIRERTKGTDVLSLWEEWIDV